MNYLEMVDDALDALDARDARGAIDLDRRQPSPARPSTPAPSSGAAVAAQAFRIVPSVDAGTGRPCWVVTDDVDRVYCPSAEIARKVRAALG